jgi:hypothetical protein
MRDLLRQLDSSGDFFGTFGEDVEYFELIDFLNVFDAKN